MPLYSDSNYYYSGGSSQLYSPYYPGTASALSSSSSIYNPYSATYNRAMGGSYVVPISTTRTPSFTSAHGLAASRYQPKLSTITETSPLISSARHTTLIPLTRIQSPKYTSYSTPTPVHTPKYIPARPILINTADIDVSANRYRKRKEETLRQAQRDAGYTSPSSSTKTRASAERKEGEEEEGEREKERDEEQKLRSEFAARQAATDSLTESSPEKHINRSTIKRNRAVVRLSTIRSRSKDRNRNKSGDSSSPEPEKKFKDLPTHQPPEELPLKWREKLAEDLAAIPSYPNKKTPGDILREKYLIQESLDKEDYAAQLRAQRTAAGLPKESIEQVIVELDPLHHTVRRLSIPQCPTFHDICEDISSDKIDDDLNAGELRRRASIIQIQEKELLNELQKSASGTFQMITMERRGSHDSVDEVPHKRHSKRSSKKGKKIRTKITAIVEVENTPPLATILQENEEESDIKKSPKPNFTANLESVEEHHQIHKVLKLPKKKSVKRAAKTKEQVVLPEGFMCSLPKPQVSPKKKFVKPVAEVFTFDEAFLKQTDEGKLIPEAAGTPKMIAESDGDIATAQTPVKSPSNKTAEVLKTSKSMESNEKTSQSKPLEKSSTINIELKTPTSPKSPFKKEVAIKSLEKSGSLNIELKSPSSPQDIASKKPTPLAPVNNQTTQKPLEKSNINVELKSLTKTDKEQIPPSSPKTPKGLPKSEEVQSLSKALKTSVTTDNVFKPEPNKNSEKMVSLEEEVPPASPKTPKALPKSEEVKSLPKALKTSASTDTVVKPEPIKIFEKTKSLEEEVPPSSPKTPKQLPKSEEVKSLPKALKTSASIDNVFRPEPNKIFEKTKSLEQEPISPADKNKKEKDPISLKTNKPLDKSSSLNIELKTPASPKTGLPDSNKEEREEHKVAIPKPIKKTILKSDSGEDFWEQIGTRETLYMNKRKKEIVETQWKKREELLESTNEEEVKNIKEIKSVVTSQKIEALKKSDEDHKNSGGVVSRSNSNESALKKKSATKSKEEDKSLKEVTDKNIYSPVKNKLPQSKTEHAIKTPLTPKDSKIMDGQAKTTDIAKTPVVTKMSKETSLLSSPTSSPSSPATKTFSTTTTSNTTASPKIIGQPAKSPEQQESAEQNKFFPTAPAKSNINKNEIDIKKTTETNEKQLLAKTFTLPTENTKITLATSATGGVPEATTTKQPEIKQVKKAPTTTDIKNAAIKPKPTGIDNKIVAAKQDKTDQEAPNINKSKASPNAINSDQFVPKAPAKTNTSPVKVLTKLSETAAAATATASTSATSSNNATATRTPDKNKTTTTTSTNQTNAAEAATTTTAFKAAKKADDSQQICNKIKNEITANTKTNTITNTTTNNNKINGNSSANDNYNDETTISNSSTGGGNLSKFATVSNLAQCLHDVDADLADYLPSSAETSENEDFETDDSDFDYSSIDGWDKLTPSMKKKVKQRRRKEKQAEQARFDPQKKVKIDTTRKLYVKDEAPRFPLVATPRPLWKREKIVYPVEDSDDESDSEESGSTEETEDSDECTTSEEYEDAINPLPSGVVGNVKSDSGTSGGEGGLSDTNKENSSIIRMSTCSNDSGFEGGTAPSSPKKMLECDVNCHKKCERLTANLCGVNQKLIVEALANVKRGARDTRDSPSSPPSSNPVYNIEAIEEQDETSYTYSQFQKSGRFTPPATIIPRFKNYTVDDFHFLAVLGKGSFGKVLLAELRDTTYYYAVKCLKKDVVLEDDDVDSTLIERKVLALGTKHPYLCHLFCTFQTESHLFFVMEYLNGGDLMFHIQESGRFTEERARFYGAEIVSGLKFLHKKGIIYRDLKLDNVLLDYEGHVRIADFGMCKLQIYLDKTADSFCGTPDYMAPEIIKGDNYNQNVDWWSFGVLLYEMLIGQSPFSGCDEDELFWSICNELPWFPVYISAEATSILKGLLEKDYTKRIGSHYSPAGDIVEHIFFRPIDWNLLEKRQIEPPFRPQVKHPLDTQYFDRVFTRERVRLTPIDKDILQSMDQKQFLGFTYTNPHITLD